MESNEYANDDVQNEGGKTQKFYSRDINISSKHRELSSIIRNVSVEQALEIAIGLLKRRNKVHVYEENNNIDNTLRKDH